MSYSSEGLPYSGSIIRLAGFQSPVFNTNDDDYRPIISVDLSRNTYLTYVTSGGDTLKINKINVSGNLVWQTTKTDVASGYIDRENFSTDVDPAGNLYLAYSTTVNSDKVSAIVRLNSSTGVVDFSDYTGIDYYHPFVRCSSDSVYMSYTENRAYGISGGSIEAIVVNKYSLSTGAKDGSWVFDPSLNIIKKDDAWDILTDEYVMSTMEVDSVGNIIVVYTAHGRVDGGDYVQGIYNITAAKYTPSRNLLWIKQNSEWNSVVSSRENFLPSIAIDSENDVYMAFETVNLADPEGDSSIVMVKLSGSTGETLWNTKDIPAYADGTNGILTTNSNFYPCLVLDSEDKLYLNYHRNTAGLYPSDFRGGYDVVVARIDRETGAAIWVSQRLQMNTANDDVPVSNIVIPATNFHRTKQHMVIDNADVLHFGYSTADAIDGGEIAGGRDIALFRVVPVEGIFDVSVQIVGSDIILTALNGEFPENLYYYTVGSMLGWTSISGMTRISPTELYYAGSNTNTDEGASFKVFAYSEIPSILLPPWLVSSQSERDKIIGSVYPDTPGSAVFVYGNYPTINPESNLTIDVIRYPMTIAHVNINGMNGVRVTPLYETENYYTFREDRYYYIIGGFENSNWSSVQLMTLNVASNTLLYDNSGLTSTYTGGFKIFEFQFPISGAPWDYNVGVKSIERFVDGAFLRLRSNVNDLLYTVSGIVTYSPETVPCSSQDGSITVTDVLSDSSGVWYKNGIVFATGVASLTGLGPGGYLYSNYDAAGNNLRIAIETRLSVEVNFEEIPDLVCFDAPVTMVTTTDLDSEYILTKTYSSSNPSVLTVSGDKLVVGIAGSATITSTVSSNCVASTSESQSVTVLKVDAPVVFSDLSVSYACTAGIVSISASNEYGRPVVLSSSNPSVVSISGMSGIVLSIGETVITASIVNDAYVNNSTATQTMVITKATPDLEYIRTVSNDKIYSGLEWDLSAVTSTGLSIYYYTTTPGSVEISGQSARAIGPGLGRIFAAVSGDDCYLSGATQNIFLVRGRQVITFPVIGDKILDLGVFDLCGYSDSGLPLSYSTSTPSVVSISGSTVELLAVGSAVIMASQGGNANYAVADDEEREFTVVDVPGMMEVGALSGSGLEELMRRGYISAEDLFGELNGLDNSLGVMLVGTGGDGLVLTTFLVENPVFRDVYMEYVYSVWVDAGSQRVRLVNLDEATDVFVMQVGDLNSGATVFGLNLPLPGNALEPRLYVNLQRFSYNIEMELERIETEDLVTLDVLHPYSKLTVYHTGVDGVTVKLELPESEDISGVFKRRLDEVYWRIRVPFSYIVCYSGDETVTTSQERCGDPFSVSELAWTSNVERTETLRVMRNATRVNLAVPSSVSMGYVQYMRNKKIKSLGYCCDSACDECV